MSGDELRKAIAEERRAADLYAYAPDFYTDERYEKAKAATDAAVTALLDTLGGTE